MAVQVYGCNHVVIEVTDAKKAARFYQDVFGLKMLRVEALQPDRTKHFGLMVRDAGQIKEVRTKLTKKYKLKLHPDFRCDFRDPWGNRIQVGDLSDESLVWLLPYQEVQKAGITFAGKPRKENES
jgi:hypothetical protein